MAARDLPKPPADLPPDLMLDFDQEARRLRAALGLDGSREPQNYNDMDRLWVDEKTGGVIWVGNEVAAKGPLSTFEENNIGAVVNCTDDMPNFLEGAGPIYFRFNVAYHTAHSADASSLAMFVGKLFVFVDAALAAGQSVLIHCLAGAHRAGTTGCLLLMFKEGLSAEDAVLCAQDRRPIINPIGQLPLLLRRYEALRVREHDNVWAEAEAARQAQDERIKQRRVAPERSQPARGHPTRETPLGRDHVQSARAEQALASARAASQARAREEADAAAAEYDAVEERAHLEACLTALDSIGSRADQLYAHAHHLRQDADEKTQMILERVGALPMLGMAPGAADDYYTDDFEEDDDEEEAEGDEAANGSDLARLRAAVEESRSAVQAVEQRLQAAEADEPSRTQHAAHSAGALLAASVANALGVPQRDAELALTYTNGDLEKAVAMLTQ